MSAGKVRAGAYRSGGFLLDTNVCIEFVRGNLPTGLEVMRASGPELFKISSIVLAELYTGMAKSKLRGKNRARAEACLLGFLEPLEVLPFDSRCATQYATIRAELERRGSIIGPNDLLIAATALANGCVMVTNNTKEFERVPGLRVESWSEVSV